MAFVSKLCEWLCGCTEQPQDECVPAPMDTFTNLRQVDEYTQKEVVMSQIDIAVMEAELPDATLARNVDLQIFKVEIPDMPGYDQEIKLPRTARVVQWIVPEGATYVLRLGYADDNGERGLQVSWGQPVELVHQDTLMPDAPGPFGEIRMIDEYTQDVPSGTPDTPVSEIDPPVEEEPPVVDPPVVEPPVEEEPPADVDPVTPVEPVEPEDPMEPLPGDIGSEDPEEPESLS